MTFHVDAETDPASWNGFVTSQPSGNFLQSYEWGQFQRRMGWDPQFCKLTEGSQVRGTALLLSRTIPGVGRVYHAPRGPTVNFEDGSTTSTLLHELSRYVDAEGGVFLRVDPYVAEHSEPTRPFSLSGAIPVPRNWSSWNGPRLVFWLSLEGDEEDVMMRMTSRCRNDVRRGYRNDVDFSLGDADDIEEFYRLMVATGQHKEIAFHGIDYYRALLSDLNGSAKAQLFLGRFGGEVVTAGMSVRYGDIAWLLYAASDPEYYKLRANRTQQWEMIKWAHEQGCGRYDFRGTATDDPPRESDPGYGVYQFKKSFGPEFTRLVGYYDLVCRPLRYRMLRMVEDHGLPVAYRLKTLLQKLPRS